MQTLATTIQTLAMTIQKLPGGGYAMTYAIDGEETTPGQAYAACSTLHEVFQRIVHPLAQNHFQEAPVAYVRPYLPPAAMSEPLGPPANGHDLDMPNVVRSHNGYSNGNGHLSAIAGALLLASSIWLSTQFGGWAV